MNNELTQDEVSKLADGTKVTVIWDGGNGPHDYLFKDGSAYTFEGIFVGTLGFVGKEKYHQKVWLTEDVK